MTVPDDQKYRRGFFQNAGAQVTLLIAATVVMLIFAWNYI
jgi:hypothetical protein